MWLGLGKLWFYDGPCPLKTCRIFFIFFLKIYISREQNKNQVWFLFVPWAFFVCMHLFPSFLWFFFVPLVMNGDFFPFSYSLPFSILFYFILFGNFTMFHSLISSLLVLTIIISPTEMQLAGSGLLTIPKDARSKEELLNASIPNIWHDLCTNLQSESLCVKPARDGCSTGVARLRYVYIYSVSCYLLLFTQNTED